MQKEIDKAARAQGFRIERTKKGHRRYIPPDPSKPIVIGSGTASDYRAEKNLLSQLRRSGLIWPPPNKKRKKK